MATPPRLVLDTNVCLDLFVFGDAQCVALREALRTGAVEAVTDETCRAEWLAVLGYPQLALDAARRDAAVAAFDAQLHLWSPLLGRRPDKCEARGTPEGRPQRGERSESSSDFDASMHESLDPSVRWGDGKACTASTPRLPRCADPDDQKFLELAQASGAQWLLSRDRELLKLARRTRREHGFDIATPQGWAAAQAGSAPASSVKPV